jgi:hypothetical protein
MAKFSKKVGGKEVGSAAVYAEPHTGKTAGVDLKMYGYPETGVKTTGIKVRGTGAATKGLMARGPMA